MNQPTRRRQVNRLPRERRVAEILEAARAVFTQSGYENALISDIAERAGVVEGSIYRYFENKRDLLTKVIEHWYGGFLADDESQFPSVRGTWNRLRYLIWHHLSTIHGEPALSRLVFTEFRPNPAYRTTSLFALNRRYTARVIEVVKDAVASGEFRPDVPPHLVRDMIYGCIEHYTWAFVRGEGDFEVDTTADRITDIVYRGLVAHPETTAAADPLSSPIARLEKLADRLEAAVAAQNRKTP